MLRCNFVRLVKQIDRRFKFYHRPDEYTNSSLWFVANDGCSQQFVCAVPTGDYPEYSIINKDEFVRERGWRAVLRIILDKSVNGRKLVDKEHFWHVLRKNGIWNIDQVILYETDAGTLHKNKTTSYNDYHRSSR